MEKLWSASLDPEIGKRENPVPVFSGLDKSEVRPLGRIIRNVLLAVALLSLAAFLLGAFGG